MPTTKVDAAATETATEPSTPQNRARRLPGIGDLAHETAAKRPVLDTYLIAPSPLPFRVICFERHCLTSQVFIPIRCTRLLIVVAPDDADGQPDTARATAFVGDHRSVIHYRAGVWHSPLVAMDDAAVLSMLMWEAGDARDCEEVTSFAPLDVA